MLIKNAAASLAIALLMPAAANAASGDVIIRLDRVDAGDPAAVQDVLGKLRLAGAGICRQTGSRIASQSCVEDFVKDAIRSVHRTDLRTALVQATEQGGGSARAAAALPEQ